ncbi:hypothetical protein EO95_11555 [Methanosarcina sp. 1.H.T.1A.1]|uniref:DUF4062 domain-containing protein n=1 Tax=Methanosarcina sp. 1.H.T.1A.1 TaxID=1483602 RepID=UPI00062254FD|nr:DUF4062 domain-containing protein [Methanosarcina sp. 1.H.T.1A.1]KKH95927.1 hypothetical protein EO95_11555 [Methanosarcina sp. 1.H.T.1A.1]
MIRKLLKKLGWNDSDKKPEEYTEKPTYGNISQSLKKNEEPVKVNPPTNTKTYVNNSQSANESKEPTKVNHSDDTYNDLRENEWKSENVKKRQINVFVSSTFKDMQAERDELVKRIFPQLRKLCEERGVTWGEVDLRWGITDEQKAEGKVLPICLAEIEHCRPYFIGILGERYGWVDDKIPQAVIEQYEWLNEYKGKSVTELEILHGVLRNPKMADHAFFYFRDPSYLNSITENERNNYIEAPTDEDIQEYGPKEAERRAEEKKNKLLELKKSIRNSGFPVSNNYTNPKVLGELVLRNLSKVINGLYPESEKLDPLEQARFEHESFAESRFNIYIERKGYFDRLDAHVKDDGMPLVVVGDSGSGKSALLANWVKKYQENGADKPFLLVHYIGATPDSVDWVSMLRRIMSELKRHFDIRQDIPDKPDELNAAFANWLHMAAARGRMVLIIDALNQLEDHDGALELFWLQEMIPPNVRLIVSSLPGRSLDELMKRRWSILEVKPLDVQERQKLIVDYLGQYHKNMSVPMIGHVASYSQTSNPLYLRALLEEIRLHGDHDTLPQRIDFYLSTSNAADLYDKILERYEQDYDRDRKNLVTDTFSYLWAARKGLSEIELREMLGSNGDPLPGALWSPLYLAAEKSLVNRYGLLSFSHDYLRTAVKKRYLETEGEEQDLHLLLADYFEKRELSKRKVEELPWQLGKAKSWNMLADLLIDPSFFEMAWNSNQFDVRGYWVLIEDNSELSMVQVYKPIIDSPSQYNPEFVFTISQLFYQVGYLSESFSLSQYLIGKAKKLGNKNILQMTLLNHANILYLWGDFESAMKLYKEVESICTEIENKESLAMSIGNQANILYTQGNLESSMNLLKEQEKIVRELGNKNDLQNCLLNQSNILYSRGELEEAMNLLKEQEMISKELGSKDNLQLSLGNQANILYSMGNLDGAMTLHKEEERICRDFSNKEGLQRSLGNQALIFKDQGDFDSAINLHKEEERLCREMGYKYSLQMSLANQALILVAKGDLSTAMKLFKEQESICREIGSEEYLRESLRRQSLILFA